MYSSEDREITQIKKEIFLELKRYLEWEIEAHMSKIEHDNINNSLQMAFLRRRVEELEEKIMVGIT